MYDSLARDYEFRLQNLLQTLKVLECNNTLEELLENIDKNDYIYTELKDMEDNFNEIAFDNYVNGKIHDIKEEIISILKYLY